MPIAVFSLFLFLVCCGRFGAPGPRCRISWSPRCRHQGSKPPRRSPTRPPPTRDETPFKGVPENLLGRSQFPEIGSNCLTLQPGLPNPKKKDHEFTPSVGPVSLWPTNRNSQCTVHILLSQSLAAAIRHTTSKDYSPYHLSSPQSFSDVNNLRRAFQREEKTRPKVQATLKPLGRLGVWWHGVRGDDGSGPGHPGRNGSQAGPLAVMGRSTP